MRGPSHTGRTGGTTAVGTSSVTLVAANQQRRSVLIQNNSDTNTLYISWGTTSTATTANTIVLAPGSSGQPGASLEISDYLGPVFAIASGADTDVRYGETGGP